ncbi:MAG TPA: DHH family phosphoesterase [Candidatus Nanoarchaeia archaeon]|nr:DHH family phosphoesterase [Candidatus Nanoarchaeia archaeon]
MRQAIKDLVINFNSSIAGKKLRIISHFDTDGITSAAIMARALQRAGIVYTLDIVKGLEESYIQKLPEDEILFFTDLASGSLNYLANKPNKVFILDHHEIAQKIPSNVTMVNPLLFDHEQISGAGLCYLFAKELSLNNKDLAKLAVIGMVGDMMDKEINKVYSEIIQDSEVEVRKGLLLYPSTRPLDRALEYASGFYIPGVTGSYKGVLELLRDAGLEKKDNMFKSLYELTEEEMSRLVTAIMLRVEDEKSMEKMIGNLYIINFLNKKEDAREISALINACSRIGRSDVALGFCLSNKQYREQAEKIYIEYKQHLVSALRYVEGTEKIAGKNYAIINAKDNIKDTIIGTVTSIISHSPVYTTGTMIIGLAYNEDKIKVSARIAGREGKNVREILSQVVVPLGGEVGGHPNAAGCLISKAHEEKFISELRRVLDIELLKV